MVNMGLETVFMLVFTGLLAIFTGILAFTTRKYTRTTEKLLRQSEQAYKQSRGAFLANMLTTVLNLEQQNVNPKLSTWGKYWEKPETLYKDIAEIFGDVDENLKKDFVRAFSRFCERMRERSREKESK